MSSVKCNFCQQRYKALFEETNQGVKCACYVTNTGIYGAYGSYIADGNLYEWEGSMPNEIFMKKLPSKESLICDSCVQKLIDEKKIILKERGNYFGD